MNNEKITMFNLKKCAKSQNIKLVDIAVELDVRTETISQYISGKINPTVSNLVKIAKLLNTTTDYLLDLTDNPNLTSLEMTEDEHTIISLYRKANDKDKGKILGYILGLSDLDN